MPECIRVRVSSVVKLSGIVWTKILIGVVPLSGGHFPVTSVNSEDTSTDPSNKSICIVTSSVVVAEKRTRDHATSELWRRVGL